MNCFYHPDVYADAECYQCGKALCPACRRAHDGRFICPTCMERRAVRRVRAGSIRSWMYAWSSFGLPGLGQFLRGESLKGLVFLLLFIYTIMMRMWPLPFLVWAVSVFDAYDPLFHEQTIWSGRLSRDLIIGIVIIFIGVLLLPFHFRVDFTYATPIVVLLVGALIVVGAARRNNTDRG